MGSEMPVASNPGTSNDPRWFCLHTLSRAEKALAADLTDRGIDHFLPLIREVTYYGRRKFVVARPLFPGYLFLRGTIEETWAAERTSRVAKVIPVADQETLDDELAHLRLAIDRGAPLSASRSLHQGDFVEVKAGPFRGLRGWVDRVLREDRLVLRVGVLNRAADLEIDRTLLVPVDTPVPA